MDKTKKIGEIEKRINALDLEKQKLIKELDLIKKNSLPIIKKPLGNYVSEISPETPKDKIQLFKKLFCCRTDVYPKMWENSHKRTKGYSPVCKNEWIPDLCKKPITKCSECSNRSFSELDENVIRSHLEGKMTIGTYTILEDNLCIFLAADFDKSTWHMDIKAYQSAAIEMGIEIYIEKSRSGDGAHAWIFFEEPIKARLARQLGSLIMAKASYLKHDLSLDSYDRFFPSQDTIPKGGFGNLIALPLQKARRQKGNTVFLDEKFKPYKNQWKFLSKCRRLSQNDVHVILDKHILPVNSSILYQDKDVRIAEETIDIKNENIKKCHGDVIPIGINANLIINIESLPSKLITALKRTATFANPKYFELQRLRFSTWRTPKYIFCGELLQKQLILPRGTLEKCKAIITLSGAKLEVNDHRLEFDSLEINFSGNLNLEQDLAVSQMLNYENGVLVAPTGSGKTVMACKIIADRMVPTLILVHRKQLIEQWINHLSKFLNIDKNDIGFFSSNKKKLKGMIDVSMLQTLSKKEDLSNIINQYGHIVVDECHHIPAFSFESVLKKFPARYFLGLTATPYRKDGHQPIIYMQCGPIRYEITEKNSQGIKRRVIVRETSLNMPPEYGPQPPIHEIWDLLIVNEDRLKLVANDVIHSLKQDRFPLILSERKDHISLLYETIQNSLDNSEVKGFLFVGEMGKKARKIALEEIQDSIKNKQPIFIISTGSLIGEGFDLPELDTLMLTMPISFKGRVVQYAGRLHRNTPDKSDVLIYDYVDTHLSLTLSMFKKRISAYKNIGYDILSSNPKIVKWVGKKNFRSVLR